MRLKVWKKYEQNIEYINKIVEDLQDYARPLKPTAKETDLEKVIEHACSEKHFPANIKVSCNVEKDAKSVIADPDLLKRILDNLMNNAIQAMPNGGDLFVKAFRDSRCAWF